VGGLVLVGGEREIAEVMGGRPPVGIGDALPYSRGWERGATVAPRAGERQRAASVQWA